MAKKQQTKRAFDWRTYSKPDRELTEAQEFAFTEGVLAPVLSLAAERPQTRFEIRARSAQLYHRGASVARITGDGPFVAEMESGDGVIARRPVETPADVAALVESLRERFAALDAAAVSGAPRSKRDYAASIATGNSGDDLFADDIVVVDLDYSAGKRRFDLMAVVRTEGVTGPGGFSNPMLAFIDLRTPGQSLTGNNGLSAVAADLAEFAKALGGDHLERTRLEIADLVAQKVRLGLLPEELDVRALDDRMPRFIVAFAEYGIESAEHDAAIVELHDRLAARHFPTERLAFVDFTVVPDDGDGIALSAEHVMSYREFKAYRTAGR